MLTIVLVSSSVFAKTGTETISVYDTGIEITIDFDNSSILVNDSVNEQTKTFDFDGDISLFSNYTIVHNNYTMNGNNTHDVINNKKIEENYNKIMNGNDSNNFYKVSTFGDE
jgi:hypothetical protein